MNGPSASASGKESPSTDGVEYESGVINDTDSPEKVFSEVDETRFVVVVADKSNGNPIYWGWDDNVDSTNGVPLYAGQSLAIDIDVTEQNIYVSTDTGSQIYRYASLR